MSIDKSLRKEKIRTRIRSKISGTKEKPRLAVFRSNKAIYAQLIDDAAGVTLVSTSPNAIKEAKGSKVEISKKVGELLAKAAIEKGIKDVVFDRGGYLYHGRVKALADGAREGGLNF